MLVQWEPVDLETVANESDRCSPLPLDPTMVVAVVVAAVVVEAVAVLQSAEEEEEPKTVALLSSTRRDGDCYRRIQR